MSGLVCATLERTGVAHAFGTRDAGSPPGVRRPVQVHGARIVRYDADDGTEADGIRHGAAGGMEADGIRRGAADGIEADGIWSDTPGVAVAVVTADCVPVLLASAEGRIVAAVHAGWRGLAAGVIEKGVAAMQGAGAAPEQLHAGIGPHIGPCCYEVDAPVVAALRRRHDQRLEAALRPGRPGHHWLDLGSLVGAALFACGLAERAVEPVASACTACDATRFHSYRRDGAAAGRLLHWIAPRDE